MSDTTLNDARALAVAERLAREYYILHGGIAAVALIIHRECFAPSAATDAPKVAEEAMDNVPRTRCSVGFAHQPHDFCDGNPGARFGGLPAPSPATPGGDKGVPYAPKHS